MEHDAGQRVLGAAGPLADAEDAGQGVQTVSEGQGQTGTRAGYLVTGKARQILLLQSMGHLAASPSWVA